MTIYILIGVVVAASVITGAAMQFLSRRHILQAMEHKSVTLKCHYCGLLVARFEQLEDFTVRCANCTRRMR